MNPQQQGGDESPVLNYLPLNDGDGSPVATEEIIRNALQEGDYPGGYQAWLGDLWADKSEFIRGIGALNIGMVLDPLMQQRRWIDAEGYLRRGFKFHWTEAVTVGPAVPSPERDIWDFRWTHPELYALIHAQDALESILPAQGNLTKARADWADLREVVLWTTENSGAGHGRFLLGLESMRMLQLFANQGFLFIEAQVAPERLRTSAAIRDYLNTYLPEASGRMQVQNARGYWQFADAGVGFRPSFRCLVCHQQVAGNLHTLRAHLRQRCPACTDCVRNRLPGGV